jgi:hypothetical protein
VNTQPTGDLIYLGDGGYQIWLWAERPNEGGWHRIALEPKALAVLNAYDQRLRQAAAATHWART